MKILVIEDEHKIANSIKKGFEIEGMICDVAYDGIEGYDLASIEEYDCIVLDLMLPGMDGVTICKKLRGEKIHTPILMLTAKGQLEDKVEGLNSGADDYLVKPFAFAELLARVKALGRRPKEVIGTKLEFDGLIIDTIKYTVERNGVDLRLSKKEYSLLEYLMRHPNTLLSKDQIIQNVWSYDSDVLPNTVEVYIRYLRDKVDRRFKDRPNLIHTVRGFGYKLSTSK